MPQALTPSGTGIRESMKPEARWFVEAWIAAGHFIEFLIRVLT